MLVHLSATLRTKQTRSPSQDNNRIVCFYVVHARLAQFMLADLPIETFERFQVHLLRRLRVRMISSVGCIIKMDVHMLQGERQMARTLCQ